jgi:hypothetical protein
LDARAHKDQRKGTRSIRGLIANKNLSRDKKETFRDIYRHVDRSSICRSENGHVVQKMSQMALTTVLLTSKKEGEISGINNIVIT